MTHVYLFTTGPNDTSVFGHHGQRIQQGALACARAPTRASCHVHLGQRALSNTVFGIPEVGSCFLRSLGTILANLPLGIPTLMKYHDKLVQLSLVHLYFLLTVQLY